MPQVFDLSKPRAGTPVSPTRRESEVRKIAPAASPAKTPSPPTAPPAAKPLAVESGAAPTAEEREPGTASTYFSSPRSAIARLLHAVALEEIALARLLHAEVEKVERLSSEIIATPSFDEVIALQRSAADVVHVLVRKEELLMEKLNVVLALSQATRDSSSPPETPKRSQRKDDQ